METDQHQRLLVHMGEFHENGDQGKVERLREQLPAVSTAAYLNAGTNGPMSRRTIEAMHAVLDEELVKGRIYPGVFEQHAVTAADVRIQLANLLGGTADEFALCQSTNDGLNIALNGMTWHAGDEVVTTNLEHPGLFVPLGLLGHRFGVRTRVADIGDGGGDILPVLEALVGPRTRVVALSHVMWASGAVLDLAPIADLAHRHGAMLIVDGAQSIGQIPVDMPSTGADAYTISGQKWLAGPEGSGAVWISRKVWADIAPSSVRYGQFDVGGYYLPAPGARRYEMGENNPAVLTGLKAAIQFLLEDVGPGWAYDRVRTLGARLLNALAETPAVSVHTPTGNAAGLVCFNINGHAPATVAASLFERGFTIRYVTTPPCPAIARAAVGWWNTEDEIDGLVDASASLAATPTIVDDPADGGATSV